MGEFGSGRKRTPKSTLSPTIRDLEWAAGFLEGEGNFAFYGHSERVSAGQVNGEPLFRLQGLFGGNIYRVNLRHHNPNNNDQYRWVVCGARARGVMMTLFLLLSQDKRNDIKLALVRGRPYDARST